MYACYGFVWLKCWITPKISLGRSTMPSGGHELPGPATSHGFQGLAPDVFVNVSSHVGPPLHMPFVASAALLRGVWPPSPCSPLSGPLVRLGRVEALPGPRAQR